MEAAGDLKALGLAGLGHRPPLQWAASSKTSTQPAAPPSDATMQPFNGATR